MIRYQCLILDHDDTVVQSTRQIHYPAFVETLKQLRPNMTMSVEEFISANFHYGFYNLCTEQIGFDSEEMKLEYQIWKQFTQANIPEAFLGMKDFLIKYRNAGGKIAVVSHSESKEIIRDFLHNFGFEPDLVFGWELPIEQRKPYPYPVEELCRQFQLQPKDMIMLDDSKPGYTMCQNTSVPFIGNGYYQSTPEIMNFMKENSDYYVSSVEELYSILFK